MISETILEIIKLFLLATVIGFATSFSLAFKWQKSQLKEVAIILLVLAIIGACSGTAGGLSRVGAVGTIIPAFLGLLGGVAIYLFGSDRSKGLIASFGAVALSISLIISYISIAKIRTIEDERRNIKEHCLVAYTNPGILSSDIAFKRFTTHFSKPCAKSMRRSTWNAKE